MCLPVYICLYTHVYICVCAYCIGMCACVCMCICVMYVHICTCVCTYIHLCICMCMCVYFKTCFLSNKVKEGNRKIIDVVQGGWPEIWSKDTLRFPCDELWSWGCIVWVLKHGEESLKPPRQAMACACDPRTLAMEKTRELWPCASLSYKAKPHLLKRILRFLCHSWRRPGNT